VEYEVVYFKCMWYIRLGPKMKNIKIMLKTIPRKQACNKGIGILLLPLFVFLLNIASFSQTSEYVYQIPKKLNDGWDISSLSDEGINKEAVNILEFEDFKKINMSIGEKQKAIYNGKVLQAEKGDITSDKTVEKGAKIL